MTIPTITIFVRHSANCPRKGDEFYKNCRCPKHLRYTYDGKQFRVSAKTRSWSQAEERRRSVEAQFSAGTEVTVVTGAKPTIEVAVELYLSDKLSQGLDPTAHTKHKRELGRMTEFMTKRGKIFPNEIGLSDLTEFRAGWTKLYPSSLTRSKVQERLRGFLRYCLEARLIDHLPKLSPIKVIEPPTLPLTEKQYAKLLEVIPGEFRSADKAKRLRALIRLMRHSGLAIHDSVTLPRTSLTFDNKKNVHKVITSRQKTGVHVAVAIPADVAEEVTEVMKLNGHPDFIFWNRLDGKPKSAVDVWERAFKRAFVAAGMPSGHSHQLRDTFAIAMLDKGIPLEEVSKLLGHRSIKTTEKSYAPWVVSRQDRLDSLVMGTFA